MKHLRRPLLFLLTLASLASLIGCSSGTKYSSIPQSRPSSWEAQIPGMGSAPARSQ